MMKNNSLEDNARKKGFLLGELLIICSFLLGCLAAIKGVWSVLIDDKTPLLVFYVFSAFAGLGIAIGLYKRKRYGLYLTYFAGLLSIPTGILIFYQNMPGPIKLLGIGLCVFGVLWFFYSMRRRGMFAPARFDWIVFPAGVVLLLAAATIAWNDLNKNEEAAAAYERWQTVEINKIGLSVSTPVPLYEEKNVYNLDKNRSHIKEYCVYKGGSGKLFLSVAGMDYDVKPNIGSIANNVIAEAKTKFRLMSFTHRKEAISIDGKKGLFIQMNYSFFSKKTTVQQVFISDAYRMWMIIVSYESQDVNSIAAAKTIIDSIKISL
ncbi:MAG: hypothetical protein ABII64_00255 [Elusimicrobiota bacterium]